MNLRELLEPINAGEYELKKWLRAHSCAVEDVSDNPKYWAQDIDLFVTPEYLCYKPFSAEVKWDNRISDTGNLYIELRNPRSKEGRGWYYFCKADYIFYGDSVNQKFYIFKREELFDFIKLNKDKLRWGATNDGSQGLLVPLEEVKGLYTVINLNETASIN
ncbi:MAG: hypothetical protein ACI3T9_01330 [Romboutsia timonensis]